MTSEMFNIGHVAEILKEQSPQGEALRQVMLKIDAGLAKFHGPETDKPHFRGIEQAKLCIYLGVNLTEEEVKQYQDELRAGGIPCRNCNGTIPGHHCSHPTEGPFTRIGGKCTSCDFWKSE